MPPVLNRGLRGSQPFEILTAYIAGGNMDIGMSLAIANFIHDLRQETADIV